VSTVRYFRSDDAGAPTLSGEVGSLTNLLRKCLVGVGGVAYGAVPSAGWSEEFIGAASNIAVFKNNESEGGCGCYVRVNDNAPGAAGAREAQITVYAAMTDINTGVAGTNTPWFRKSAALSNAARPWLVVADGLTAWVYVLDTGDGAIDGNKNRLAGFGDYACVSNTSHRYFCLGALTTNSANAGADTAAFAMGSVSAAFSIYAEDGVSGILTPAFAHWYGSGGAIGSSDYAAPLHPISGDSYYKANPQMRVGTRLVGAIRGLIFPYHSMISFTQGVALPGYTGAVVVGVKMNFSNNANYYGQIAIDTLGPWP
jgi:hypothetical protein